MQSTVMVAAAAVVLALSCAARADTIYVSNEQDDTVAVIDGERLEVTATIPVGRRPRGITLDGDKHRLFVAVGDDDRIDVVDLATRKVVDRLPSGEDPELFVLHPDGRHLYVSNENDNVVSVVDVVDKKIIAEIPVGVEPEGMAASPDGKWVVNTSETTSMAHFIDVERGEVTDNVLVDTRPRVAQFTPDGAQVWVSSELRGTVSIIDTASKEMLSVLDFEIAGVPRELIQPVGIRISRDGKRGFVALGPANRVVEIDPATLQAVRYYLVGNRVWNIALSNAEDRLYAANGNSGDISVIDLKANRVVKSLAVGRGPWGIVVGP